MTKKPARGRPYVVCFGTQTRLIWAASKVAALDEFITVEFPWRMGGRLAPPARNEVLVRRLRPNDRGWIEEYLRDHGQKKAAQRFLNAIPKETRD